MNPHLPITCLLIVISSTMNNNLHTANFSVTANMYKDLPLPFKVLNICHINVQSLINKLDEIKLILSNRISSSKSIKSNLILGLSKTFLDNLWDNAILAVDHYTFLRSDRNGKMVAF